MRAGDDGIRSQLGALHWVRLEFIHEVTRDLALPPFKGAIWRGALGEALMSPEVVALEPRALGRMFGENGSAPTAAWALCPPLTFDTWLAAGTHLTWWITLYGNAADLVEACVEAARILALRQGPLSLKLVLARQRAHGESFDLLSPRARVMALDVFDEAANAVSANTALEVRFVTPMSLRDSITLGRRRRPDVDAAGAAGDRTEPGRLPARGAEDDERARPARFRLREAPHLDRLLRAIPHAFRGVAGENLLVRTSAWPTLGIRQQSGEPRESTIEVYNDPWPTPSSRQDGFKMCKGIVGLAMYPSGAGAAFPWLVLGQHLHLGEGRRFGLGLIVPRPMPSQRRGALAAD